MTPETPSSRRSEADLPPCTYRGHAEQGRYACAAAEGGPVTPDDCRACSIPGALAHAHACLYLVPMRHQGECRYACRWFFSFATEPAPSDWHQLCFCPYWFPRPPQEDMIPRLTERRAHYLRVLRGEATRTKRIFPATETPREAVASGSIRAWIRRHFGAADQLLGLRQSEGDER